jgi:serine/threonine-protein kinase
VPPAQEASRHSTESAGAVRFVPGAILGERYRIVALLGRGGMGEVYRADDLALGQQVALKFLPAGLARNEDALRRFRNEVRIARQVSHPNVCRVYDVGEVDGNLFLSMEYVDGEDLASLLRRIGRLPPAKGLEIARKLCVGLAAAHDKGVLHRDLKPGNIMLDGRGHVLLTDFGLAGIADDLRGAEVRSGTPAYMAPEQLRGSEVTARSDIYALGLVLYEIFTGERPHQGTSLAELLRLRSESAPESPSSFVRDLDPAVESAILRCLEPDPRARPQSALAVAAALPGGDPLAAALAAGETPSPQMVAAASASTGVSASGQTILVALVIVGMVATAAMAMRTSALERMRPELPPQVLAQRAKEVVAAVGYGSRPADSAMGFYWYYPFVRYVAANDKPEPDWSAVLSGMPSLLRYWYRQSETKMTAGEFHSDLLIPGLVTESDPAPIQSGMVTVRLDARGGLVSFEAAPPQLLEPSSGATAPPDWAPLFSAAGLNPQQLQRAEPLWTWLASSDTRVAWTGVWPGTNRPLRVEAAALRGRPVAFALLGPWDRPERMVQADGSDWNASVRAAIYGVLAVLIFLASAVLARRNLALGRGDRRGAFRLAVFVFALQSVLWLATSHLHTENLLGMFLLSLCTSVFYAVILWTVYLALEPYVRRHWPRTLISWSRLLGGQWRDPIVGRDVLVGAALGMALTMTGRCLDVIIGGLHNPWPTWTDGRLLMGAADAFGAWLARGPHRIRDGLLFFFLLFLLRVLLRRQWLAGVAFVSVLSLPLALGADAVWASLLGGTVIYGLAAFVVFRFGLLALTIGFCVSGLIGPPVTMHVGAWYFWNVNFLLGSAVALTLWAWYTSLGSRSFWASRLFTD